MVPSDLRKTNFVVDDTCTVRGKLVSTNAELANTKIQARTFTTPTIETQTLQTQNLIVNGVVTPSPDALFSDNVSSIVANQIAEFTTNASTEVKSINDTGSTSSGALDFFFMTGTDGNQTISSSQTMTRDMYFDTLTVTSTGILDPAGFMIFCKTALVNNGIIRRLPNDGGNGAGGIGGSSGSGQADGTYFGAQGGASGGNTNVNGGNAATTQAFGGLGGSGGNSDTKTGGTSTATLTRYFNASTVIRQLLLFPEIFRLRTPTGSNMLGFIPGLGGGGGAGGSLGAGGGGGGGGGEIAIVAKSISGTGTIEVKGGNGGTGQTSAGGGGGGGGGVVYIISRNNMISSSQVNVSGGTGGAGGVGGQNGENGHVGLYQNNVVPA